LYNCSDHLVCFQEDKGFILAKQDTKSYLSQISALPVVIVLAAPELSHPGAEDITNALLLVPQFAKSGKDIFTIHHHGYTQNIAIAFLRAHHMHGGHTINILNCGRRYLSSQPASRKKWTEKDYESTEISFSRSEAREWEIFSIVPINSSKFSGPLDAFCGSELEIPKGTRTSSTGFNVVSPQSLLGLWTRLAKRDLASNFLFFDKYKSLSRASSAKAKHTSASIGATYKIDATYDYLGRENQVFNGQPISLRAYEKYIERTRIVPSKGPCIIATARNESIYLPDWCSYHFGLGFEHIYLYTNNNDDLTKEIALRIAEVTGMMTVIDNIVSDPKTRPQYKSYRHALSVSQEVLDHSWCAIIDIDEYLMLRPVCGSTPSILQFIQAVDRDALTSPDVIVLNWIFAGIDRSFYAGIAPPPLPKRIGPIVGGENNHIKSIFKPRHFLAAHCHYPVSNSFFIPSPADSSGQFYCDYFNSPEPAIAKRFSAGNAAVLHYYHKSFAEFMWKNMRNTGDMPLCTVDLPNIEPLESFAAAAAAYHSVAGRPHASAKWLLRAFHSTIDSEPSSSIINDKCISRLANESWRLIQGRVVSAAKLVVKEGIPVSSKLNELLDRQASCF